MMRTLESNVNNNDSISDNFRPTCQRNDRKIRKCRANPPPTSLASLASLAAQLSRIFGSDRCWPVSWQMFSQPVSLTVFATAATVVIAVFLQKR